MEHYDWNEDNDEQEAASFAISKRVDFAGTWHGPGAPIRQLVFSDFAGQQGGVLKPSGTLLAARMQDRIAVLRVTMHHRASQRSQIEVTEVASIQGRNECFAHVSFDPSHEGRFVITDQAGEWSIYKIQKRSRFAAFEKSAVRQGCINDELGKAAIISEDESYDLANLQSLKFVHTDKWTQACWVVNDRALLAYTRRRLMLFDILSEDSTPYEIRALGMLRNQHWILGVQRSSSRLDEVFALTSAHVYWLKVTPKFEEGRNSKVSRATVIFSWRHFRDAEDTTMHMTVLDDESKILVLIHSRLNGLITQVRFSRSEGQSSPIVTAADPTMLSVKDLTTGSSYLASTILNLHMRPMALPEENGNEKGNLFFELLALDDTYQLRRAIMYTGFMDDLQLLTLSSQVQELLGQDLGDVGAAGEDDIVDFVVPDNTVEFESLSTAPNGLESRQRAASTYKWSKAGNIVVYDELLRSQRQQDILEAVQYVRDILGEKNDHFQESLEEPLGTLLDMTQKHEFRVSDLLDATTSLLELLADFQSRQSFQKPVFVLRPLATASVMRLPVTTEPSAGLRAMYDQTVQHWISSLPAGVSSSTRVAKDRIAKAVATDLCLSSVRPQWQEITQEPNSLRSTLSVPQASSQPLPGTFDIPIRPAGGSKEPV
ncbi:hypothetical protein LTS18_008930, partial [Coniosporium uncinatum]